MKKSVAGIKRLSAENWLQKITMPQGPALSVFCVKKCLVFFIIFSNLTRISWAKEEPSLSTIIEAEEVPIQEARSGRQFLTRNAGAVKQNPEELVSDIHCMRTTTTETFTSFLRLPQNFLSPPVLENVGSSEIIGRSNF